jgi:hypothetical protein
MLGPKIVPATSAAARKLRKAAPIMKVSIAPIRSGSSGSSTIQSSLAQLCVSFA